jgi:hypothetical protein
MKKILLTLFFFTALSQTLFAQNKYLVYFTDKGISKQTFTSNQGAYLLSANNFISDRSINRRIKSMGEENYFTYEDLPVNQDYKQALSELGIKIIHSLKWFNAVSCYLNEEQIQQLQRFSFIKKIERVKKIRTKQPEINASNNTLKSFDEAEDFQYNYGPSFGQYMLSGIPPVHNIGISGEGVLIGVLDSGFRRYHEAFNNTSIINERDFVEGDSSTSNNPGESHGTFVLSLIGTFYESQMVAPAFSADFILARTEDVLMESHIEEDNYAAALEWFDSLGVDITTSSLAYSVFDDTTWSYTYEDMDGQTAIVTIALNLAFERGIITVTAAGNEGFTNWKYIVAPADAFNVISVGAVTDQSATCWWHSRGPTSDGRLKPEICAQGEGYGISANYSGGFSISTGAWGTSGATPIAAGITGMLLSAFPHLNNIQVRSIVTQSGDNVLSPDTARGYGILSAVKAITFPNLKDDNGIFQLNKIFIGDHGINKTNAVIHYKAGNGTLVSESLTNNGGNIFNFNFPILINPDTIWFYFTYEDTLGTEYREPLINNYKFYYGDLIIREELNSTTSVENEKSFTSDNFALSQNYPNPFNPSTNIEFFLPSDSYCKVTVSDVNGQLVKVLAEGMYEKGSHRIVFNGKGLASGVYIYSLFTREKSTSRKLILLK